MKRLTLLLATLLAAGCYDNADAPPPAPASFPPATATLADLRSLYAGKTFRIESDVVVTGYVTTDDRAGNFYRTLLFEQEGAAAELMAGIDGLRILYPPGCRIAVNLNGLALGESRGVLQIGRFPEAGSGYATDYIGSQPALDRHVFVGDDTASIQPLVCDIASLRPEMAGRLIRIDGLRFAPETIETAEWAGTKRFTDADGNAVYTYTRSYADFAQHEIPLGELLLVGTLQCDAAADGSCRYTLRMRDETDCWY